MTQKSHEVLLRSVGAIAGRTSPTFIAMEKAVKAGDPEMLNTAQGEFLALPLTIRERIRLHAESYAKLLRDG